MKKTLAMMLPLVALGCGSAEDKNGDGIADGVRNPDTVSVVAPATPKGTVSGQVLTTRLTPLEAATVAMTIGNATAAVTAQTDKDGNFMFKDVPGGATVLVTFSKQGYATLRSSTTVPVAAGNVPLNNGNASIGPIALAELNGSLSFAVLTPLGRPAAGAKGTLEASPAGAVVLSSNNQQGNTVVSRVVAQATSDANGVLTFTGIPSAVELDRLGGQYRLWIEPLDLNNDNRPDTNGYTNNYAGSTVVTQGSLLNVSLDYPQNPTQAFTVDASNVSMLRNTSDRDPLRNMVRPGDPIYVTFNHAVQPGSVLVMLTGEDARDSLSFTTSVTGAGNVVVITPGANVVQQGKEYNLYLRAVSAQTGVIVTRTAFFFGGDLTNAKAIGLDAIQWVDRSSDAVTVRADGRLDPGERVYIYFNQPIQARNAGSGSNVEAFFDTDIDSNGSVGGSTTGEMGNLTSRGVNVLPFEPNGPNYNATQYFWPLFPITQSGYTTRFYFDYNGTRQLDPATAFRIFIRFSVLSYRNVDPYETMWGAPISADQSITPTALPQNTFFQ